MLGKRNVCGGDVSRSAKQRTDVFPQKLPLENNFKLQKYFVRPCYPTYYRLILALLGTYDIITLTGTPGKPIELFESASRSSTGTSSSATRASIRTQQYAVLTHVVVFRKDGTVEESSRDSYAFMRAENDSALGRGEEVIFLFDGPPSFEPSPPFKMVCFPSPNENWFKKMSKKDEAYTLYMPLWNVDELVAAALHLQPDMLDPPITRKVIEDRFAIFGGVARTCLTRNNEFFLARVRDLEGNIVGMDVQNVLVRLDNGIRGEPSDQGIIHYMPQSGHPARYQVQIASKFVSLRVLEKMSSRYIDKRDRLLSYLHNISEGAAYRGHLIDMKVHELLVRGVDIETTQIPNSYHKIQKTFKCEASDEFYFFNPNELSRSTLEFGPYHISREATFDSIDSFYYPLVGDNKTLLLFQMTMTKIHPVNGKRVVETLTSLGLLEESMKHPKSVALVFVSCTHELPKQDILWDSEATFERVGIIPNIGDAKKKALAEINIITVGELRTAIRGPQINLFNDELLEECVSDFENFDERQELTRKMLVDIPQYEWNV